MTHVATRGSLAIRLSPTGLTGLALIGLTGLIEWSVPHAKRWVASEPNASRLDFLPASRGWDPPDATTPLTFVLSYPMPFIFAGLCGVLLIYWDRRLGRLAKVGDTTRESLEETLPGLATRERHQRQNLGRRRKELVEPLIGAFLISATLFFLVTLVAGKLDPPWARAFLAPPLLVFQVLQTRSSEFAAALLTSGWNMTMAMCYGTAIGLLLGYVFARFESIGRWTVWHVISISALPPIFLQEVLHEFVKARSFSWLFPVRGDETAFKLGAAMATWAVIWPVLTASVLTLSSIDREHRLSFRLLGARTAFQQLRHLEFPNLILPVMKNLRIGFVIGLIVLIIGEGRGSPPSSNSVASLGGLNRDNLQPQKIQELAALLCLTTAFVLVYELLFQVVEWLLLHRVGSGLTLSPDVPRATAALRRRESLALFEDASRSRWAKPLWAPQRSGAAAVEINRVGRSYGDRLAFAETGSRSLRAGTFVSIIGRSGAGKSTLLKLLVGLVAPQTDSSSLLRVAGVDLLREDSQERVRALSLRVGYVAQRPLLLPHLNVEGNLLFGLRLQWREASRVGHPADGDVCRLLLEHGRWVLGLDAQGSPNDWRWPTAKAVGSPLGQLILFLGLDGILGQYPNELSGGEAQRVHVLRWLVLGRSVLLLDEAFSALDQPLKALLRDAVRFYARLLGTSVVNVSHDRADVLQCSDRVLFVDDGVIAADGTPEELFFKPATGELALFLGHSNLFMATAQADGSLLLHKDLYRNRRFEPPVALHLKIPATPEPQEQAVFFAQSDINLMAIQAPGATAPIDSTTFLIYEVRFIGAELEIHLCRAASPSTTLYLSCVFQEDDLRELLRKANIVIKDYRELVNFWARVAFDRVLALPFESSSRKCAA